MHCWQAAKRLYMFCTATVTCCTLSKVDSSTSWQCAASSSNASRWPHSVPASRTSTVFTTAAAASVLVSKACKQAREVLRRGHSLLAMLQQWQSCSMAVGVNTQPQLQAGTWWWACCRYQRLQPSYRRTKWAAAWHGVGCLLSSCGCSKRHAFHGMDQ